MENKVTLELSQEQAHLVVMAIDAGLINLHAFQATLSNVFYKADNEAKHKEMMERVVSVKNVIYEAMVNSNKEK